MVELLGAAEGKNKRYQSCLLYCVALIWPDVCDLWATMFTESVKTVNLLPTAAMSNAMTAVCVCPGPGMLPSIQAHNSSNSLVLYLVLLIISMVYYT